MNPFLSDDQRDLPPHKRDGYTEERLEQTDIYRDYIKENGDPFRI